MRNSLVYGPKTQRDNTFNQDTSSKQLSGRMTRQDTNNIATTPMWGGVRQSSLCCQVTQLPLQDHPKTDSTSPSIERDHDVAKAAPTLAQDIDDEIGVRIQLELASVHRECPT